MTLKTRRYCKLKEEALDCILWRIRFGRGYGPVVRQTMWYDDYDDDDDDLFSTANSQNRAGRRLFCMAYAFEAFQFPLLNYSFRMLIRSLHAHNSFCILPFVFLSYTLSHQLHEEESCFRSPQLLNYSINSHNFFIENFIRFITRARQQPTSWTRSIQSTPNYFSPLLTYYYVTIWIKPVRHYGIYPADEVGRVAQSV